MYVHMYIYMYIYVYVSVYVYVYMMAYGDGQVDDLRDVLEVVTDHLETTEVESEEDFDSD